MKNEKNAWKLVKCLNIKKCEIWYYESQKNHILKRKTAIKIKLFYSRRKKFSLFADTELQVDQIKRKIVANTKIQKIINNLEIKFLKFKTTQAFE